MIEKYRGPKAASFLVTFLLFLGITSILLIITFTVEQEDGNNITFTDGQEEDFDYSDYGNYSDYENYSDYGNYSDHGNNTVRSIKRLSTYNICGSQWARNGSKFFEK